MTKWLLVLLITLAPAVAQAGFSTDPTGGDDDRGSDVDPDVPFDSRDGWVRSEIPGGYRFTRNDRMVVTAEWDCYIDYDGWYTCEQVWP